MIRISAAAVVCILLGLGAALITPAAAVAGEVSVSVLQGQGPPLPDPIVPARPTRTPAPPAPTEPDQAQPGSAVPGPAVPGPDQPGPAVPGPDTAAGSSCGIWDVSACVNDAVTGLLRKAVTEVVNPGLELLSDTLLQTPAPSTIPRLGELWQISWQLTVSVYGIVILVGALIVMGHQSVQTRYGLREIGPRLVVGFVAGWLTLPMADMAVQIANAVSDALLRPGDEQAGMRGLAALVQSSLTGPGFVVLLFGLMVAVALIAVLVGYILRVVAIIVLVAAAPLVVMWHALPQTDGIARWWWRALAALLSIQIIQALVLSIAVTILLPPTGQNATGSPGGRAPMQVLGLTDSGWVSLLVLGALLWVLVKVPGWAWSQIRLGGGGRSLLGTVVRTAIAIKTGGLLRSALTATAAGRAGRTTGNTGPRATGGGGEDADPYTHTPTFTGGQLGLPLSGLRRRPQPTPAPAMPRSTAGTGQPAGGARRGAQLALPLGQDWPENRPVADRNSQWALPIDAERVARPAQPRGGFAPHTPTPTAPVGRGQMRLPSSGQWPETQPVLGRDGQYRLPIPARRRPRPRPPAPAVAPVAAAAPPARARQLSFDDLARDLDPFRGNRPLAGGQYPLPLPGVTRQPRPPDRPRPTPTPPPPSARTAGRTTGRPSRPVPGQTRLPIPTTPPRRPATPPPRQPPPPAPPSSTPTPPPSRPRPSGPRRRPGQENTP